MDIYISSNIIENDKTLCTHNKHACVYLILYHPRIYMMNILRNCHVYGILQHRLHELRKINTDIV